MNGRVVAIASANAAVQRAVRYWRLEKTTPAV